MAWLLLLGFLTGLAVLTGWTLVAKARHRRSAPPAEEWPSPSPDNPFDNWILYHAGESGGR